MALPNTGMTFVPFDILTAQEMNDLVENIESLADGTGFNTGAIGTTDIADGGITNAKLSTASGDPGASWQTYVPVFTGLSVGNGTLTAKWGRVGKTTFVRLHLLFGTTTSVSGAVSLTLPTTSATLPATGGISPVGLIRTFNGASSIAEGSVILKSTTEAELRLLNTVGTFGALVAISSSLPFGSWSTNYEISATFIYETA